MDAKEAAYEFADEVLNCAGWIAQCFQGAAIMGDASAMQTPKRAGPLRNPTPATMLTRLRKLTAKERDAYEGKFWPERRMALAPHIVRLGVALRGLRNHAEVFDAAAVQYSVESKTFSVWGLCAPALSAIAAVRDLGYALFDRAMFGNFGARKLLESIGEDGDDAGAIARLGPMLFVSPRAGAFNEWKTRSGADLDVLRGALGREQLALLAQGKQTKPPDVPISEPIRKPGGWTRKELVEEAKEKTSFSATVFDKIREAAHVEAGERGGGGQHRRFTKAMVRKLIAAVEVGPFRYRVGIAAAWRELLAD